MQLIDGLPLRFSSLSRSIPIVDSLRCEQKWPFKENVIIVMGKRIPFKCPSMLTLLRSEIPLHISHSNVVNAAHPNRWHFTSCEQTGKWTAWIMFKIMNWMFAFELPQFVSLFYAKRATTKRDFKHSKH